MKGGVRNYNRTSLGQKHLNEVDIIKNSNRYGYHIKAIDKNVKNYS